MLKTDKDLFVLSIRLMVFNHADFLTECLTSIDNQITNFKFELVIGDDFSKDSSLEIIKQFNFKNKNISVNILKRSKGDSYHLKRKRFGRLYNFKNILENCSGKYIALLDGDDFWTYSLKLQKQVDFLESNQEFNYCGHKSSSLYNGILKQIPLDKKVLFFEDLIFQNSLNTATLLFRENSIDKLPDFFLKSPAGDWALQLIAIKGSSCYILDDDMSVYRIRNDSIWGSLTQEEKCMNGVKVQELSKNLYTDKKSIRLINRAIKQRKKASGILKLTLTERLINRLKNRIR